MISPEFHSVFSGFSNLPLILDGAVGSWLEEKSSISEAHTWSSHFNISNPDLVFDLHKLYIDAGADIITTNTFRTNPSASEIFGQNNWKISLKSAVKLAKQAVGENSVLIAGSNPPAEDCYQANRTISTKQLERNHFDHINNLLSEGCDFILHETQSHLDEILLICKYCTNNNIKYALSIYCTSDLNILSGEKVIEIISLLKDYSPSAVLFNCINLNTYRLIRQVLPSDFYHGFYPNLVLSDIGTNNIKSSLSPIAFTEEMLKFINPKILIVGACCGSSPEHIKELSKKTYELFGTKITG